jgi:hypothetical protein
MPNLGRMEKLGKLTSQSAVGEYQRSVILRPHLFPYQLFPLVELLARKLVPSRDSSGSPVRTSVLSFERCLDRCPMGQILFRTTISRSFRLGSSEVKATMTQNGELFRFRRPSDGRTGKPVSTIWSWRLAFAVSLSLAGCGRVVSQKATDQLIAGDAVDRSIAQIDFRIFTGKKVFLDTQFVNKTVPGVGFVTSEYIVSSIRQKMMCDGCLIQEKTDEADFVVEMRIGALGADGHEIVYGMPPNNYMSLAASVTPTSSPAAAILPSMPELSIAKRDDQMAAAKVALFAYNRRTREPIWQSGISESRSLTADRWFFGAGPFQKGNIYSGKSQADSSLFSSENGDSTKSEYFVERRFADPTKSLAANPPDPKTPAVAATQPAKTTTPAPTSQTKSSPTASTTATSSTAATTPTPTAPVTALTASNAVPTVNPPSPGPAVPLATPTPSTAPAATAGPAVGATQTVNAAPSTAATPLSNAAPAPNLAPPAANIAPPAAATSATGSANIPANAPKTVPSVNSMPNGQPVNATTPPNGTSPSPAPDMLSVSVP